MRPTCNREDVRIGLLGPTQDLARLEPVHGDGGSPHDIGPKFADRLEENIGSRAAHEQIQDADLDPGLEQRTADVLQSHGNLRRLSERVRRIDQQKPHVG